MRAHPNQTRTARGKRQVHVATGYGISIHVQRGHLVVEDGTGRSRQAVRFNRATSRLGRMVVIGSTGYVTLGALRWLADTGCGFVHLDHSGRLITTSAVAGVDNPPLRRALAMATRRPIGREIGRQLLAAKLEGQAAVADTLDAEAARTVRDHLLRLQAADSIEEIRQIESQAALSYWSAWRGICVRFANRDAPGVPVHWTTFAQRVSVLTGNPRIAVDPINAVLNYLYAVLEAEARLALAAVGLDAGLGVIHADQHARDSLALDLMEAARPSVDAYVLDLVARRPLSLKDVHETRNGQCRLLPRLSRELVQTAPTWAGQLAPHAETVARLLSEDAELPPPATRLTETTRRQARPAGQKARRLKVEAPAIGSSACSDCGVTISPTQKRCSDCHATANAGRLRIQQADEAARRRATGRHPSEDQRVRDRIGQTQSAQWAARKASERTSGFTGRPSEFQRLILPRLAGLDPHELARTTGLSTGYCAQIRDGKRVPHPRHWAAFQLAGLTAQQAGRPPS